MASLPNVQYLGLIQHLVDGNWTYQDEGILDHTHLRFFTYLEIEKLFHDAGYEIIEVDETIDPQYSKATELSSVLNIGRLSIRDLSPEEFKRFFVFQYKISAKLKSLTLSNENHVKIEENNMNAILVKGKSLENDGEYEEAIKLYQDVMSSDPGYVEILARIGNCFMCLQDLPSAESQYRKSLSLSAHCYTAQMGLGLLKLQQNDYTNAINQFLQIIEINPDSDKAWSGLGIAYRKVDKIVDSMDALSNALNINIENDTAMSQLIEISYEQNLFKQIGLAINKYLDIHPTNINMLFGLAGIQYKTKLIDDSQNTLSKILSLDPENNDAIKMLEKIDMHSGQISN